MADLHRRVQRAIRRAARSSTFTILKRTIAAKEDMFSKRLLEALQIWYAKFPSSKKRGCSLLAGRPPDSVKRGLLDYPEESARTIRDWLVEPVLAPLSWAPGAMESVEPVLPRRPPPRPRRGRGH